MKTTKSPFHVGGKWTWEAHQLCCTKALEETTVAHTVALDHLEALQQRVLKFRTALAPVAEKVGLLSCAGSLDPDALTDVIGDLVTLVEAGGQEFRKQEELIRAILPLFPLHADRRACINSRGGARKILKFSGCALCVACVFPLILRFVHGF